MDDIYTILAKHFLKETTKIEEKAIFDYKLANPQEYKMLLELWYNEGIDIFDFDSDKAWRKFVRKIERKPEFYISKYWNIKNIAASIAFILLSAFAFIYFFNGQIFSNKILIGNSKSTPRQIELIDGTNIWINQGGSVSFIENFENGKRELDLKGKAFFDVEENKLLPFTINTINSKITVLGTSFNIESLPNKTEVTVKSGRVEVKSEITAEKMEVYPNESAVVLNNELTKSKLLNINYQSWMTGIFEFNNTPLLSVINDLNTFYNDSIVVSSSKVNNCNLTAKFERLKLNQVIEIIETACNLRYEKSNNKYVLDKNDN